MIEVLSGISADRRLRAIASISSVCLAIALLTHYSHYPSVKADAWAYQYYAISFRELGFLSDLGSIRTYGYPLFLYLLSFIAGTGHEQLALVAGAAQYLLFFVFATWLSKLVARCDRTLASAVLVGLLLNPFVLALVTDALSDGLSFLLGVLLVILALCADQALQKDIRPIALCLFAGSAAASYAVMVRPANLVILAAWFGACIVVILTKVEWRGKRLALGGIFALCVALSVCAVFAPQFYYNMRTWQTFSFLPVCQLSDLQVHYGVLAWKYESYVDDGIVKALFYANPFSDSSNSQNLTLHWYIENPLRGVATVLAHTFASFSVTNIFTYRYHLHPWWAPFLIFAYWVVTILGVIQGSTYVFTLVLRRGKMGATANYLFSITLISSVFAGTVAMNGISAVEIRYNVFPIAVTSIAGIYFLMQGRANFSRRWIVAVSLALVLGLAGTVGSLYMGEYAKMPPGTGGGSFDLRAHRCFLKTKDAG